MRLYMMYYAMPGKCVSLVGNRLGKIFVYKNSRPERAILKTVLRDKTKKQEEKTDGSSIIIIQNVQNFDFRFLQVKPKTLQSTIPTISVII